jgi:hypothetical protein
MTCRLLISCWLLGQLQIPISLWYGNPIHPQLASLTILELESNAQNSPYGASVSLLDDDVLHVRLQPRSIIPLLIKSFKSLHERSILAKLQRRARHEL